MVECTLGNIKIHVEVPVLLFFFACILSEAVYTNLIIYRTCYVTLGYNESDCALLGGESENPFTHHLEELVQPHAAVIIMVRSFVSGLIAAVICFFAGPWSDKFGRKPVILLPLIGFMVSFIVVAILSMFPTVGPWYFSITIIPIVLTGGFSAFITGTLSYITDVTSEANRGLRMGIFEAVLGLGILLGNITSPYLFYATGYAFVFSVCAALCGMAALFTYFFITESLIIVETEGHLKEIFQISCFKEMFKTAVKKRECYGRAIILCCVLLLTVYIFVVNASSSVMFLYVRDKFQWSLKMFTTYSSTSNAVYLTGTLFGVYVLHRLLKVTESFMVLTGFISLLNCALLQGLATKNWHMYFATAVHGLSGTISPMVRSLVSKCVNHEEVGKIFSLIVISEEVFGLIGPILYTEVYNSTITSDPGFFNYISASLYGFSVIVILAVMVMQYKRQPILHTELDNPVNDEENNSIDEGVET